MKTVICNTWRYACLSLSTLLLALAISGASWAGDGKTFLNNFIRNYNAQNFDAQVTLVKEYKELIPRVVSALIKEAKSREFEERMFLLNIASSIAYMHLHWHEDDKPLKEVEPVIKKELEEEQARIAEIMKWKKEERFLGNFVMKRHRKKMEEEGLPMVLYPHWLHRILYECKACHDSVFKMRRWENDLSQTKIAEGEQCGTCHDGTTAFSATDDSQCERCHIVGKPEADRLHNPAKVDQAKIAEAAKKVGAEWHPEKLPDGKLPLDRFKFIDWLELKEKKIFTPVNSLNGEEKGKTRDNKILFKSNSSFVSDVIFDHKIHADWIKCSSCHPAVFKEELGGNRIKMVEMSKGLHCGHCHGKVSFTFSDCLRCHKREIGKLADDASRDDGSVLKRESQEEVK